MSQTHFGPLSKFFILFSAFTVFAQTHEVTPTNALVIPVAEVMGTTDINNNARTNPNGGGYFSLLNDIHDLYGNCLWCGPHGNNVPTPTAFPNDWGYWDKDSGLAFTKEPAPDLGGGDVHWWPMPTEWVLYEFNVSTAGSFKVLYRFTSGVGPDGPLTIHTEIDGASSGPIELKPDDPENWTSPHFYGNSWVHSFVSGTGSFIWELPSGQHKMKVVVDKFPQPGNVRGTFWFRYFKVMQVGTGSAGIIQPRPGSQNKIRKTNGSNPFGKFNSHQLNGKKILKPGH